MDIFTGYLRQNGQVGIRNDLLILNLTGLTSKVAERIHQNLNHSKLVSFEYGMGLLNKDKEIHELKILYSEMKNNPCLLYTSPSPRD